MRVARCLVLLSVLVALVAVPTVSGGGGSAFAQEPSEDTSQAPAEVQDAQPGAQPSGEPAATPTDEPADKAANESTEQMDQPADGAVAQPVEDTVQTPTDESVAPSGGGAEQTEPPADTATPQPSDTVAIPGDTAGTQPGDTAAPQHAVNPDAPYEYVEFAAGEKPHVIITTTMGDIEIELWPDVAPRHCQSFVHLVKSGFYDSLTFHRVVPGFIIQGGDPLGNGTGGPGYTLRPEFSDRPHKEGTVSMARLPNDPNTAGSQFFICLGRLQSLDGEYTVFGEVVDGLNVIHDIERVPVEAERPRSPVYMTKVRMKLDTESEPATGEPLRER